VKQKAYFLQAGAQACGGQPGGQVALVFLQELGSQEAGRVAVVEAFTVAFAFALVLPVPA
jgi:hypothetical protein